MSIIKILKAEVAGRIAAGEVIERPASVVKELVENSLDAGATRIRVLTEQGGAKMIHVIDNGCGMDRADALTCLEAHATSKISTEADVGQIHTLGFRGEAMPSISSVSRFELQTREHSAAIGTEVIVDNGTILDAHDCGCAPGTSIKVSYLFGNLPARRKFLKGPATEDDRIAEMLLMLALTRPGVGFDLLQNGRSVLHCTPADDLATRVQMLLGRDAFAAMQPVDYTEDGIHVYGFISKPGFSRNSRREQRLIINRRAAAADAVYYAIRTAYETLVPSGRYPGVVLYIDMADDRVDVNVHPAKREVRFRDPIKVTAIVAAALRNALRGMVTAPILAGSQAAPAPAPPAPADSQAAAVEPSGNSAAAPVPSAGGTPAASPLTAAPIVFAPIQTPLPFNEGASGSAAAGAATTVAPAERGAGAPAASSGEWLFKSRLGTGYLLAETPTGLVIVSVKAAMQRIAFERLLENLRSKSVAQQQLLMPVTVNLSPDEARLLVRELEHFKALGYSIEPFGAGSFIITAVPANQPIGELGMVLRDILSELRRDTVTNRQSAIHLAQLTSRHTVDSRKLLTETEQRALLHELMRCTMPYTDPAGLPTMVNITYSELKQRFQN